MINKVLCIILLFLFILIILQIFNKKTLENFASDKWTTDKNTLETESQFLNDNQKNEVKNMIKSISKSELKSLISSQSPLLTGPRGPQGPQGPSGTKLIASGRLINKSGSFDPITDTKSNNYFIPQFIVTRTQGTNPTSSLAFMDNISPFGSFQNWQLDINNNIINRYDNTCLTMDNTASKLYMSECKDNPNQKWNWDNTNRIISTTASDSTKLKCIGLTKPEVNILTTNIPDCKGNDCLSNSARKYLIVKDCDINNINEDELWSFI